MKKFFSSISTKVLGLFAVGTASAMAAPVTVDLTDATTSITNAGNAMVLLAVAILGFAIVIGFISRRR